MLKRGYVSSQAFDLSNISKENLTTIRTDLNEIIKKSNKILVEYTDFLSEKIDAKFENNVWVFKCLISYSRYTFNFEMINKFLSFNYSEEKKVFLNLVKSWTAMNLGDKSPGVSHNKFTYLLSAIYITNGFNKAFWDKLLNTFKESSYYKIKRNGEFEIVQAEDYLMISQISAIIDFLHFYNHDKYHLLIKSLQELILKYKYEIKNRQLPGFKDILKFKDYLDYWFETTAKKNNNKELLEFYPLVLWWNLTSIIPMRPSEFCKIKRDCLTNSEGKFYVTFPRFKFHRKGENREKIKYDTLPISHYIYGLFQNYIMLTQEDEPLEYLINYKAFLNSTIVRKRSSDDTTNFHSRNLRYMLKRFYLDILNKRYNINILPSHNYDKQWYDGKITIYEQPKDNINSTILIGDLRHIAIINMMMQGYDKVEIQRLAGHLSEDTQFSYFNHMDNWMNVEIQKIEREILKASHNQGKVVILHPKVNDFLEVRYKQLYIDGELNEDKGNYIQLSIGYCKDNLMTCPTFNWKHSGCYFCKYWTIDLKELEEKKEVIKNDLNLIYEELKNNINFMKSLYKIQFSKLDNIDINMNKELSATANEVKLGIEHVAKLKIMLGVKYYE